MSAKGGVSFGESSAYERSPSAKVRPYIKRFLIFLYTIHVITSAFVGCHLDISIDGYDVGGWTVDGGEEAIIDRPTYVPKKFTFYRVKTAPKEAGIKSGRSENGEVKCVFTPEASFDVQVITSGSSQPENVNMFPSATVGDLKREVQSQLKASDDPDQVLVQGDKVLSNVERLRSVKVHLMVPFTRPKKD